MPLSLCCGFRPAVGKGRVCVPEGLLTVIKQKRDTYFPHTAQSEARCGHGTCSGPGSVDAPRAAPFFAHPPLGLDSLGEETLSVGNEVVVGHEVWEQFLLLQHKGPVPLTTAAPCPGGCTPTPAQPIALSGLVQPYLSVLNSASKCSLSSQPLNLAHIFKHSISNPISWDSHLLF